MNFEFLDLDKPKFRKLDPISGRIKVEFYLPDSENCIISFSLLEKLPNSNDFGKYDIEQQYFKNLSEANKYVDSILFQKKYSSKYGTQYKVVGEVKKEDFDKISFEFDEVYTITFPSKFHFSEIFKYNVT